MHADAGRGEAHSLTTTSAFTGAFLNDPKTRKEFIRLIDTQGCNPTGIAHFAPMTPQDPPRPFNGGQRPTDFAGSAPIVTDERGFMNAVFGWMAAGLSITGAVAWYFATSGAIMLLFSETGGMNMLGWMVMLGPLAFILAMNFGLQRMSASTLTLLFVAFSAVMGASLSSIFLVYTGSSIMQVFGITAGTFLVMAIGLHHVHGPESSGSFALHGAHRHSHRDGRELVPGVLRPRLRDLRRGCAHLHRPHRLRHTEAQAHRGWGGIRQRDRRKLALLGATSLYLDFINLFLFLLRLLGRRGLTTDDPDIKRRPE